MLNKIETNGKVIINYQDYGGKLKALSYFHSDLSNKWDYIDREFHKEPHKSIWTFQMIDFFVFYWFFFKSHSLKTAYLHLGVKYIVHSNRHSMLCTLFEVIKNIHCPNELDWPYDCKLPTLRSWLLKTNKNKQNFKIDLRFFSTKGSGSKESIRLFVWRLQSLRTAMCQYYTLPFSHYHSQDLWYRQKRENVMFYLTFWATRPPADNNSGVEQ